MTNFKVAEVDVHVLDVTFDSELPIDLPNTKDPEEEGEEQELEDEE